jgi:hypothetical protein
MQNIYVKILHCKNFTLSLYHNKTAKDKMPAAVWSSKTFKFLTLNISDMQKYDFHFAKQLFSWIFRGFATKTKAQLKTEFELHEAIGVQTPLRFAYTKEGTGELREATGKELRYNKFGNVIYHDLEANALRSFKPANLQTTLTIA